MNVNGRRSRPADRLKLEKFFGEYVKDRIVLAAARRAGFGPKWGNERAYHYIKWNEPYIEWLSAQVSKENAKLISIELEPVLQEIANIAFANEADYLIHETVEGKTTSKRKPLDQLTRQQLACVKVKRGKDGSLDYELLDKEGRLRDLGEHLGAFNAKLILEHRHAHMHAHLDLTHVNQKDLDSMERQLEQMLQKPKKKALPAPNEK